MTNFTFEDTLTQIGLGYLPLFLLGLARPRVRWIAPWARSWSGYWAAFVGYPAPGALTSTIRPSGSRGRLAAPRLGPGLALEQEQQRWPGRSTAGSSTSFPGKAPSPTTGRLRDPELHPHPGDDDPRPDRRRLAARAGDLGGSEGRPDGPGGSLRRRGLGLALGSLRDLPDRQADLDADPGSCSAAGSASGWLALLYASIDLTGYRGWTYPLRVIGRNSIAAYCLAHLAERLLHGGPSGPTSARDAFARLRAKGTNAARSPGRPCCWPLTGSSCFWMDRRRIYLEGLTRAGVIPGKARPPPGRPLVRVRGCRSMTGRPVDAESLRCHHRSAGDESAPFRARRTTRQDSATPNS